MLGKFKPGWDFLKPLVAHCGVHAFFTFTISVGFLLGAGSLVLWGLAVKLALFDFAMHFLMDRIKAGPKYLGRYKALSSNEMKNILSYLPTLGEEGVMQRFGSDLRGNTFFWWSLGIDQMVHHLTHYAIIYWLVTS